MTYQEKLSHIKSLAQSLGCDIREDEPLSGHTTVRVGGACDLFISAQSAEDAAKVKAACNAAGLYSMILGNGSNVLFSDEGFRGAIITSKPGADSIFIDGNTVTASAGAQLISVCRAALEAGLTGLEFAYGIPGTVGGAVYMNAGAYGGEIKDVVKNVRALDTLGNELSFDPDELRLGYRTSRFEGTGEIITQVSFELASGDPEAIREKMEELMARRKSRQPLEYPSFGSAFKRPEGSYAGLVIEESGLKGKILGRAQISEKHANFIINLGGATAADYLGLIELAKKTVFEKTGYVIEPEVRLIPPMKEE